MAEHFYFSLPPQLLWIFIATEDKWTILDSIYIMDD